MSLSLTLPLHGTQLIEASAGTGKTFTIALLYVRLVLGCREPIAATPSDQSDALSAASPANNIDTPLIPPEILVVTFTDAASQELRDRIRDRLVQAANAFRAADANDGLAERDPLLAALRHRFTPDAWPACAHRLTLAADWMDDAAISTIHSWCQRMLREHAFDSGNLFHQELVKDLNDATREAINDYWRTRVYPLTAAQAALLITALESPDALQRRLRPLLDRDDLTLACAGKPLVAADDLTALLDDALTASRALTDAEATARQACLGELDTIKATLQELRPHMNGSTFKKKLDDQTFDGWLTELSNWANGDLDLTDAKFVQKLARSTLKLNKGSPPCPQLPLFAALDAWHAGVEALTSANDALQPQVIADARNWVAARLAEQLRSRAQISFNDMIRGLDSALAGAGGETLAARIRTQFPVAMIDEFQDTDAAQYRIFARIYRVGADGDGDADAAATTEPTEPTSLILIGDPKQAIYGFRGGDIHTYLDARRATAGNHHTLGTNFRSSAAAVAAVNHVFGVAETTHPRRAFRFASADDAPVDNPLPYTPVAANGVQQTLHLDGKPVSGLVGWLIGDSDDTARPNRKTYLRLAAAHCANRIQRWLDQASAAPGGAGFVGPASDTVQPLQANDIAILVRDRTEAAAIRTALAERGLDSVYLSDRDSVFATTEARDVLLWLRAMANPESVSALRTALATGSLGQPLAELGRLQHDEGAWEQLQERFIDYRQRWSRDGVLPALRRLLHDFHVPQQLLGSEQGQRRLTNLLHLAEWAQEASDTLDGDHALIRQLAEHVQSPSDAEQILRLESDAALIQVVTIFKSKGLEYPLVCLPFLCTYREINGRLGTPLYHVEDQAILELASNNNAPASYKAADDERLSEDVRLLYVALTRARHATFVGLAPLCVGRGQVATLHKSALGYLLAGGDTIVDRAALRAHWQTLADGCDAIHLDETPATPEQPTAAAATAVDWKQAHTPAHPPFESWWIASYSSLQQRGMAAPETLAADIHNEDSDDAPAAASAVEKPETGTLHDFPRGPGPGTFLHGVLEALAEHGFTAARHDNTLRDRLAQRCARRGWDAQIPVLRAAMPRWLDTPLSADDTSGPVLSELTHYRAEPDFWFATRHASTDRIDALTRAAFFPGVARPQLAEHRLNGLLKGFIDLIVEHNGQYLVIDWKSNWLGADDTDYHSSALRDAMLAKRYDVQLALYLIALHRHLAETLPEYDYDRHVGGAMLVFLRGIDAPSRGVCHVKPPRHFIEQLDRCLLGDQVTVAP